MCRRELWQGTIGSARACQITESSHLPLSVLEAPVKLAPLSLLVLESVLLARSLMLLFRDRLPLALSELGLTLMVRSWMLSFRERLPLLDPGRANAFLTLSHLL